MDAICKTVLDDPLYPSLHRGQSPFSLSPSQLAHAASQFMLGPARCPLKPATEHIRPYCAIHLALLKLLDAHNNEDNNGDSSVIVKMMSRRACVGEAVYLRTLALFKSILGIEDTNLGKKRKTPVAKKATVKMDIQQEQGASESAEQTRKRGRPPGSTTKAKVKAETTDVGVTAREESSIDEGELMQRWFAFLRTRPIGLPF